MAINAISMKQSKIALGRRKSIQEQDLFITLVDLPHSDGHAFNAKFNQAARVPAAPPLKEHSDPSPFPQPKKLMTPGRELWAAQ